MKLYRVVDQDSTSKQLENDFDKNFGIPQDFLKRFSAQTWDPFAELQSMQEHMERMFDDSRNRFRLSPFFNENKQPGDILPQTDIEEKEDQYIITMNIPGSEEAEIKVDLDKGRLTVRASTKKANSEKNGDRFLRMERSMGSFQRSFPLPGPVDEAHMVTKYEHGVLTIIVPKAVS